MFIILSLNNTLCHYYYISHPFLTEVEEIRSPLQHNEQP